jgi:hypothetical protein
VKSQLLSLLGCLVLGWWGFPWGLLVTPVQVVRNIAGMVSGPDPGRPSERLETIVRGVIAEQAMRQG